MDNILQRVKELTKILEQANYDYYVLDKPTLEDWQFDSYMQELLQLESNYPEYAFPNSPTKRVGGSVASGFVKVAHKRPMLSLGNVFNENDIVLDFTMGSGSAGVACANTNRLFIGIEKDRKYYDIAYDRIMKVMNCDQSNLEDYW